MPRYKDITGQKFGHLLVKRHIGRDKWGGNTWECECSCGTVLQIAYTNLRRQKSCGKCIPRHKDLTGQRFGHLLVQRLVGRRNRCALFECLCSCGNVSFIQGTSLRCTNDYISCGCVKNRTHGQSSSPAYKAYSSVKQRCGNPKNRKYDIYGKKGVKCLFSSFEHFFDTLGPRPSKSHSLGRILDRGNYEPGNCFWMTRAEQELAKKNNRALRKWEEANAQDHID